MKLFNTKMKKTGLIALTLLIISALTVSGALMSYYLNVTVNVDSGVILEYSPDDVTYENAEDLDKIFTYTDFVGDNIDVQTWFIKASPHLQKDVLTKFTITDQSTDDPEGIDIALQYDDSGTWTDIFNWSAVQSGSTSGTFTFPPNHKENFRLWVSGDYYLMEGDHQFLIELEYNIP